jgi:HEAT repeat protein
MAAAALGWFGPDAKEAVPALIKALADPDLGVRLDAATALGAIGPDAKDAVPALQRIAEKDPTEFIRNAARAALDKIKK